LSAVEDPTLDGRDPIANVVLSDSAEAPPHYNPKPRGSNQGETERAWWEEIAIDGPVVRFTRRDLPVALVSVLVLITAFAGPAVAGRALGGPGDLDHSFGKHGKVEASFTGGRDAGMGMALQSDGKILVAGQVDGVQFAVARFLANGKPDPGFGVDGLVNMPAFGFDPGAYATSVAVQSDGKILVAGTGFPLGETDHAYMILVRLDSNGEVDTGFAKSGPFGGWTTAPFLHSAVAEDVTIQANRRIVIAGYTYNADGQQLVAFARFTLSGYLDTSFSSNGTVAIAVGAQDASANAALIQRSDGKIVAIGAATSPGNGYDILMIRLNTDGTLDSTFSGNGAAEFTDGTDATGQDGVITSAGQIIAAGSGRSSHGKDFALVEVGTSGQLNGGFGTGGKVLTDIDGRDDSANGVVLQPDGKIVVAGTSDRGSKHEDDFALARYNTDGTLDSAFGTVGTVTTSFGANDVATDIAIQPDGLVVAAGFTQETNSAMFALARYLT